MKASKILSGRKNRRIHNPFKRRNNCKQYKKEKRNSQQSNSSSSYKQSFVGFKLWVRLTWVKVGRTFR
nr:11717_t:CDS:2 [Entrophospora candida]CAG8440436.1 11058_t:CDS:2 [Entrophospora candida]